MKLYDNAFSPFARKVRMVLEHKGLEFESVDGLTHSTRAELEAANGRVEVPALEDGGSVIVNSPDIIAYVEEAYPDTPSVYPADALSRAQARAWERCADSVIDPILTDISYWGWAERDDTMPEGLLERARTDMRQVYDALEVELEGRSWVLGELSIVDIALWPHLTSVRMLGVNFDPERYPNIMGWYRRARALALFREDLERTRAYIAEPSELDVERRKLFWRDDRIEWMLAAGQHDWFHKEIVEGRVLWPGLGVPKPKR